MNNFKKIINNKKGATLIMITMLIMTSILTISLSLGSIVINGLKVSATQANATQAYFASETGAEKFLYAVRKNNPSLSACNPGTIYLNEIFNCEGSEVIIPLSNGSTFYLTYELSSPTTTITSYGDFRDTRRVIQLQY